MTLKGRGKKKDDVVLKDRRNNTEVNFLGFLNLLLYPRIGAEEASNPE